MEKDSAHCCGPRHSTSMGPIYPLLLLLHYHCLSPTSRVERDSAHCCGPRHSTFMGPIYPPLPALWKTIGFTEGSVPLGQRPVQLLAGEAARRLSSISPMGIHLPRLVATIPGRGCRGRVARACPQPDKSLDRGLTFNRSQRVSCSATYETLTQNQVVYK